MKAVLERIWGRFTVTIRQIDICVLMNRGIDVGETVFVNGVRHTSPLFSAVALLNKVLQQVVFNSFVFLYYLLTPSLALLLFDQLFHTNTNELQSKHVSYSK